MAMMLELESVRREVGRDPEDLVRWALALGKRAVVTTKFGPYSAVLLHLITQHKPDIPVLWMDSGYNTAATYRFADALTRRLGLDLRVYHPQRSRAQREALEGPPPGLDDPRHAAFTREVKLEPFERATAELKPQVWFTALRADQTEHRARMQQIAVNPDGLIKVAPLLHQSSRDLHAYLKRHGLPNNFDYFDPTKLEDRRECGLHLAH